MIRNWQKVELFKEGAEEFEQEQPVLEEQECYCVKYVILLNFTYFLSRPLGREKLI